MKRLVLIGLMLYVLQMSAKVEKTGGVLEGGTVYTLYNKQGQKVITCRTLGPSSVEKECEVEKSVLDLKYVTPANPLIFGMPVSKEVYDQLEAAYNKQ